MLKLGLKRKAVLDEMKKGKGEPSKLFAKRCAILADFLNALESSLVDAETTPAKLVRKLLLFERGFGKEHVRAACLAFQAPLAQMASDCAILASSTCLDLTDSCMPELRSDVILEKVVGLRIRNTVMCRAEVIATQQ